jgi:3-phenylpropionate/trans-cinnamate dioxygenase ferredoxin subunit
MSLHIFYKTAATIASLEENKPTGATAGSKKVCLLKRAEKVYAFAALCPHSGAPMCDGWVDPLGRVVCPLHKYRFDPANGRNTSGEGYKMVTYPVAIREGEIYIGLLPDLQKPAIDIIQYNNEIDEAMKRMDDGYFTSQEDLKDEMDRW